MGGGVTFPIWQVAALLEPLLGDARSPTQLLLLTDDDELPLDLAALLGARAGVPY